MARKKSNSKSAGKRGKFPLVKKEKLAIVQSVENLPKSENPVNLISPINPVNTEAPEALKNPENQEKIIEEDKAKDKTFTKQIYWTFGTMAFLVVVFLIAYSFFAGASKIEYNGLTFTKEKFGEIPVFHHYYYITPEIKYNLYIRGDPRKNNVAFTGNAVSNPIEFFKEDPIYISLSPEGLVGCEYSAVGISSLASFLVDNQLVVKSATTDREQAKLNSVEYATCEDNPGGVVIILKGGNETRIIHERTNCYVIEIANCEVLPAIEKFEVQSLLDAKARRQSL